MSNRVYTPRNKTTHRISSVDAFHPKYKESRRDDIAVVTPDRVYAFDTRPIESKFTPTRINIRWYPREYYLTKPRQRFTSRSVFEDPTILPYRLKVLPKQIQKEIEFLAVSIFSPVFNKRVPKLYRISDTWCVDDLGRFFREDPKTHSLVWFQYSLSGDLRNKFTLTNNDGSSLQQSAYFFVGVAGYDPRIQNHFAQSGEYDFHHVLENKLDLRPSRVVPLEIYLHRRVHEEYTKPGEFFHRSKLFYV